MKHTGNIPFGSRQTDHSSLGIFSAGVERITIDGSGNVGIGTASPSSTLDVSGNILISGGDSQISFYAGSQTGYRLYRNSTTMVLRSDGNIKEDAGSRYQINTNGSERLRVDNNGNVGINNTAPIVPLDVEGTVRIRGNNTRRLDLDAGVKITGQYYSNSSAELTYLTMYNPSNASINMGTKHSLGYISFEAGSGAYTERMRITNTGNVGIGTTAPTQKLHVSGGNIKVDSVNGLHIDASYAFGGNDGSTFTMYNRTSDNKRILRILSTSGSGWSDTVINPYGANVGVGTLTPTANLHVAGTFKSVGINDSASAQAIFINGNGEVGIGATNQTTALDVGGVFQFNTASDLLQINNDTNTGGLNLSGNNSRIYFGGHRAIEGAQDGSNLVFGEGYSTVTVHSGATLVTNGSQNIGQNLTVSGRTDLQRDLRLRGTDSSPNVGVVRMYVDDNDTLFIDAANDGNNRVEINSAGDLTVPGILTAQEFRTEYISQTIIFESGSTTFGDDADDVHTRNGSVIINKNHTGVLTGNRVDALVINNDQMSGTGPETRIKFQANSNPTATISTKVDSSGVGGGLSFEVAENPTTLTTRLKISKEGFIGMNTDPASNALLKLGLRNLNGDGILLENISNSNQVAKLYQDNGTEGILSLSNSGLEHVKIRSNGSSFFDGGAVGFGTQNPSTSHKVDIVGDLKVGGTGTGTGNYLEIIGFNQSNTVILRQFDSNSGLHSFRFETAVDGLFTFRNGGSNELVRFGAQRNYFAKNVGIGTVSAATSLDIVDEDPIIRLEDTVTGAYSLVSGNGGNITLSADEGSQDGGSHILFRTDTTDRMRIDSAGNIRFHNYGAGVLTTDSAGNVGVSTGYITQTAADTRYVNTTGDTMTGNFTVSNGNATPISIVGTSTNYTALAVKNTSSGAARVYFDAANGDLAGGDYSWVGQNNDLNLEIANSINAGRIVFTESGGEKMTISNGNVGIGTTSPAQKLHVVGDVKFDGTRDIDFDSTIGNIRIKGQSGGWSTGYLFNNGSGTLKGGFGAFGNDNVLNYFWIGNEYNNATMVVEPDAGNVGIGTTSPSDKLHVNAGDIRIDGGSRHLIVDHGTNSGSAGVVLQGTGSNLPFVRWTDGTTITAGIRANSSGDLRIQTNGFNDRVTINSSGNVGIGTTSPSFKLDVSGNVNSSTEFRAPSGKFDEIKNRGTGNTVIDFNGSDYVGIGTTSPNHKLTVNGNIRATGSTSRLILDNTQGQGFNIYAWAQGTNIFNSSTNNPHIYFGRDAAVPNNFYFSRNGTDFTMKIDTANERVGIGTLSPTESLHVAGNVAIEGTAKVVQTANQVDGTPAGTSMEVFDGNTYIGAFLDYTVYNDGKEHMRSGTIQMVFNPTGEARFTDNSTTDIGDSSPAYFTVVSAAPNTEIKFVAPDPTWHIRYHVRYL